MAAQDIFEAYLLELSACVNFAEKAAALRPRLGGHLVWEGADTSLKKLFNDFLSGSPVEGRVYQSVLVSLHSGYEQFVADLVEDLCELVSARSLSYSDMHQRFGDVATHFRQAAGLALASVFEPRAHWNLDFDELVKRLSTTRNSSEKVELYGRAIAIRRGNLDWESLEKVVSKLGLSVPWGEIVKDARLQKVLAVTSKAQGEVQLKAELNRVVALRNSLAHSQGADEVTYEAISRWIEMYRVFGEQLSRVLLIAAAK